MDRSRQAARTHSSSASPLIHVLLSPAQQAPGQRRSCSRNTQRYMAPSSACKPRTHMQLPYSDWRQPSLLTQQAHCWMAVVMPACTGLHALACHPTLKAPAMICSSSSRYMATCAVRGSLIVSKPAK